MEPEMDNYVRINWDTHTNVLLNNFSTYRDNEILTDVTLACEGYFFPAHRIVLNMCSGYFEKAFQMSRGQTLTFFIVGIRKEIFELLLSFIYNGTATLLASDVDELAKAGKMLDIPELAQLFSPTISAPNPQEYLDENQEKDSDKRDFAVNDKSLMEPSNAIPSISAKNEPQAEVNCMDLLSESDSSNSEPYEFEGWESESNTAVEQKSGHANGLEALCMKRREHHCVTCNLSFSRKYAYLVHFMKIHSPKAPTHPCNICQKSFKNKKNLEKHLLTHSSGRTSRQHFSLSREQNCPTSSQSPARTVFDLPLDVQMDEGTLEAISIPEPVTPQIYSSNVNGQDLSFLLKNNKMNKDNLNSLENDPDKDPLSLDDVLKEVSSAFQAHFLDFDVDQEFFDVGSKSLNFVKAKDRSCDLCNISFPSTADYYKHRSNDCSFFECPYCLTNYTLDAKDEFDIHKQMHQKDARPYSCSYCDYTSDRLRSRDDHIQRKHLGTGNFSCPFCDYESTRAIEVRKHAKSKHPNEVVS